MFLDVLITVVVTSFIQSIFGVGVLLFGTPLLLLQGYDFIEAVIFLLPISVSINLIQIAKDYQSVDLDFIKKSWSTLFRSWSFSYLLSPD